MGVALGVVLGSILQLIVSSIGLIGLDFDYELKIHWKNKGFRQVLRLLPPRSFDQGMDYAVSLVEMNLASRMTEGTLRAFQQATTLHLVPINLIGVAISTAAFPKMTERLGQGRPDLFRNELQSILRIIIWIALPVSVITYFTRGYLVNFINNGGDLLMSSLLGILVVAILFRSIYHIAARSFYAQQDTKTPLYISIVAISLNIILAIWFTYTLKLGAQGLAAAQSIVAVVEVLILFSVMARRIPGLFSRHFWSSVVLMASATGIMSLATYFMVASFPLDAGDNSFFASFPKFCLIVAVSAVVYVLLSRLMSLQEATPVVNRIRKLLFGRFS